MRKISINRILSSLSIGIPTALLIGSLAAAYQSLLYSKRVPVHRDFHAVATPPLHKPTVSQESINLALKLYGIKIPPNVSHPVFDPSVNDRGVTTKVGWMQPLEVAIGEEAFASWALLGSTLAHELEIHCNQSFAWINILDMFGLEGTAKAERHAYLHEISSAKRFGLSPKDIQNIEATMNYFYPKE